MTFASANFVLGALGVFAACAIVGRSRRWMVLLAASYAFYAAVGSPTLVAVLAAITLLSWLGALGIERHESGYRRGLLFWGTLLTAVGALVALKYAGFVVQNLNALAAFATGHAPLPA